MVFFLIPLNPSLNLKYSIQQGFQNIHNIIIMLKLIRFAFSVRVRYSYKIHDKINIGHVRSMLYNYLYAVTHKGKFIYKVEDIKPFLLKDKTIQQQIEKHKRSMEWLGLIPNEGLLTDNTQHGPYRQSQKLQQYKKYEKALVQKQLAYPCFCSNERLNELKQSQIKNNQPIKYDSHCRHLTIQQISEKLKNRQKYSIRMKMDNNNKSIIDLVYGQITADFQDFLITYNNGIPTTHFCHIIDDIDMKITHVIRDHKYMKEVYKEATVFNALNKPLPKYIHLPEIHITKNQKIESQIESLKQKKIEPQSIVNAAALLGWKPFGNSIESKLKQLSQIFTMDQLVNYFHIDQISTQNQDFDYKKIEEFNKYYVKQKYLIQIDDQNQNQKLEIFKNNLQTLFNINKFNDVFLKKINKIICTRLKSWEELKQFQFLFEQPNYDSTESKRDFKKLFGQQYRIINGHLILANNVKYNLNKTILNNFKLIITHLIPDDKYVEAQIAKKISQFLRDHIQTINNQNFYRLLKYCITGRTNYNNILEVCVLLGKEKTLQRLEKFLVN